MHCKPGIKKHLQITRAGILLGVTLLPMCGLLVAKNATGDAIRHTQHILVLQSANGEPYSEFTVEFRQILQTANPDYIQAVQIASLWDNPDPVLNKLTADDVLVAVGTRATETAFQSKTRATILSVLVPRLTAKNMSSLYRNQSHKVCTIYLDQPMWRYFLLVKQVMGASGTVGAVLGPTTETEADELKLTARQIHVNLVLANTREHKNNPLTTLESIIRDTKAVLALPDPVVYNRYTLPPLLLTTFRYHVPVIGFSEAFVNAGAVAGVYSEPDQIGRQAAEMILHDELGSGDRYPVYFHVSFNQAVAHALDITVPDQKTAEALLNKQAGGS